MCIGCCIRRICRKLWKKKGIKGGKGIDLQSMKNLAFNREKVRLIMHLFFILRLYDDDIVEYDANKNIR